MPIIEVKTEITGNVWKVLREAGDKIAEDEPIIILESMKMEIPVSAPESGIIVEVLVETDQIVLEGSVVARIDA
jgi:acetyl-CoA carboxylase biotin carboxyl carrier protein